MLTTVEIRKTFVTGPMPQALLLRWLEAKATDLGYKTDESAGCYHRNKFGCHVQTLIVKQHGAVLTLTLICPVLRQERLQTPILNLKLKANGYYR